MNRAERVNKSFRDKIAQLELRIEKALNYCEPHTDSMWSAMIVSILLDCEFRDAKESLKNHKKKITE